MKHVVEYKLHGEFVPYFIEDGGYFYNSGKLIGLTKDDQECYIPPASLLVTFHTKNEFSNHIITLSRKTSEGEELSEEQKIILANSWWDARH